MKHIGKRVLSMLCVLTMLLSLMAMIVPGAFADSTTTNEIDAIPSGHLAAVRYYSDFATEAGKTAYVDDAEAYGGKAVCYSLANFDGGDFLAIKRYDGGNEVSIAQMFKEDLHINDGYHTYKITYDVPADATEGAVFFIMPNWQLNSSAFCKDFAPYAGQTVEVYLSIKVTGPAANGLYSVSVDRVALATICDDYMSEDGSTCTACGKEDALLKMIPVGHRASVRDYSNFAVDANNNTVYVDDLEAYGGKAVCHTTGNPTMSINRYDAASGLGDGNPALKIGSLTIDDLKINQGYHIYKFTYDVPVETTVGNTFYIMPNWQLNSSAFCADFAPYAGQTVEVYLSIKVTEKDNLYSVYVDRVALASTCLWDNGVVTTPPTYDAEGVMTYTCVKCGATKTESVDKLVEPTPAESWGLVLGDNIGMNFVLNVTEEQILEGALVEVRAAGQEYFYVADELVNESGKAVLNLTLAAAQMTEEVEIILYVGEQVISKTYTVRQYADYVLDEANGFDDVTKNLVKYMLSYGAAAQKYFNYNPNALADADITVEAAAVPTEGSTMEVYNDGIDNVSFYGATLVYRDKIAVRYYFTAESLDGIQNADALIAKDGKYYVEIDGINPYELDRNVDYSIRADNEGALTVNYSPLTYIIRMYNKADSTQATKDLVQALYGYYLAADAYASRTVA